jgi:hypothetical protein
MAGHINATGKVLIASAVARGVAGGPVTQEEKRGCVLATAAWLGWCGIVLYSVYAVLAGIYHAVFG